MYAEGMRYVENEEEQGDDEFNLEICTADGNILNTYWNVPTPSYTSFELTEGQAIKFRFSQCNVDISAHIDFSLNEVNADAIQAASDQVYTNAATPLRHQEYSFTAPEDGTYLFTAVKDDTISAPSGDFSFELYDTDRNAVDGSFICTDSYVNYTYSLTEGETVYVKILPQYTGDTTHYRFVVRNTEQPLNTEILTSADGWKTNDMAADGIEDPAVFELSDVTANSFTINVTEHGTEDWYTQVFYELPLIAGNTYKLQFRLTADNDSTVSVALQRSHVNYDTWGWADVTASDESYSFLITADTDGLAKLFFQNFQMGTYTISDISLTRVNPINSRTISLNEVTDGHYSPASYDLFAFTAEEAGTYEFVSLTNGTDMYGQLYSDAAMTNELAFDDDGNGDLQFKISYTLEAGQTVYLRPRTLNSSDSADYQVKVTKAGELENGVTGVLGDTTDYHAEGNFYVLDSTAIIKVNCISAEPMNLYLNANTDVNAWIALAPSFDESHDYERTGSSLTWDYSAPDNYFYLLVETTDGSSIGDLDISYEYQSMMDPMPEDMCPECGGINGEHTEDCPQFVAED